MSSILLFANLAQSTLAGPITNSSLSLQVQGGGGAEFPAPGANQYFLSTLVDNATGLLDEIVQVTGRSGDVFTIVRAQEGTTALNWLAGDIVANRWTAGSAATMVQVAQLQLQAGNFAVDTGTTNALVITLNPAPSSLSQLVGVPIRIYKNLAAGSNTTSSVTLAVNGLAATPLIFANGSPPPVGSVIAAALTEVVYDGTNFEIISAYAPIPVPQTANVTFYVSNGGSDTNNGLTAGTPFLTPQHAVNVIQNQYNNLSSFTAIVKMQGGTYTVGVDVNQPINGTIEFTVNNSGGTVNWNVINDDCVEASNGAQVLIDGGVGNFVLTATGSGGSIDSGCALSVGASSTISTGVNITFGQVTNFHIYSNGNFIVKSNYTVNGNAVNHLLVTGGTGSISYFNGLTLTMNSTPGFSGVFAQASQCSSLSTSNATFTGFATGVRYLVNLNANMITGSGASNYFPGDSNGSAATGGNYT